MQAKNNKKIISISKLFTSIENNQKFSWRLVGLSKKGPVQLVG
jgi:hypothetical protein